MKKFFIIVTILIVAFVAVIGCVIYYLFTHEEELDEKTVLSIKKQLEGISKEELDIDYEVINNLDDLIINLEYKENDLISGESKIKIINAKKTGKNENLVFEYQEKSEENIYNIKFYKQVLSCLILENNEAKVYAETFWADGIRQHFLSSIPVVLDKEKYIILGTDILEGYLSKVTQKGNVMRLFSKSEDESVELLYNIKDNEVLEYKIYINENDISKEYTYKFSGLKFQINIAK